MTKKHTRVESELYRLENWSHEDVEALKKALWELGYDEEEEAKQKALLVPPTDYFLGGMEKAKRAGKVEGLGSGYWQIDCMTAGFVPGELYVVMGASNRGKSLVCVNMMAQQLARNHKCVFITLEDTKEELLSRLISIWGEDFAAECCERLLLQKSERLDYRSIKYVAEQAKSWGAEIIYIDHLHYFARDMMDQATGLGLITQEFKTVSVEYEIPIVLVSHVRKLEDDWSKPTANDARGSSFIVQDADVVLGVWQKREDFGRAVNVCLLKNRHRLLWRIDSEASLSKSGLKLVASPYNQGVDQSNDVFGRPRGKNKDGNL